MKTSSSRKGVLLIASCYLLFGAAKLVVISEPGGGSLDQPDYVLALFTKRQLLSVGVFVEFVSALICYSIKSLSICWVCLASLSGALLCYRIALWEIAGLAPCSCLGILSKILAVSLKSESIGTLCFLFVCLISSWYNIVRLGRAGSAHV